MKWENRGYELDEIANCITQKKGIIFYGINEKTIEIYKRVEFLKCPVIFCDSRLAGEKIGNGVVHTLNEELLELLQTTSILVITANSTEEELYVKKKLILKGFKENEHFFSGDIFMKIYLPLFAYYSYGKCYVDFVNHIPNYTCTLKCEKCSASIPYLKQKNPTVEQLTKEIDLLFANVDYCYTYDCTGGETFIVSEQLVKVLRYLLDNYRERIGEISITTNATVIPTSNMLQFLKEHKDMIRINVSSYQTIEGWEEKYNKFAEVLSSYEIPCSLVCASSWIDFGFRETTLTKSEQEMETYFDECGNFCRAYIDGKIYYCGHGHWANMAFYPQEDDEKDALNLADKSLTKRMIIEYNLGYLQKGYLEICRHCQGWGRKNQCYIPVAKQIEDI